MKTRTSYLEKGMNEALAMNGAFFAFSKDQFYEKSKPDVEYTHIGLGLHCPIKNVTVLLDQLKQNKTNAVEQDIKENGIDNIIMRELSNQEYGYTFDISDTLEALTDYNVTAEQIKRIANSMDWSDY